jgi:hypothetical protein
MMRAFEQAGGSTAALFQSVGSSPNLLISPSTEFLGSGWKRCGVHAAMSIRHP